MSAPEFILLVVAGIAIGSYATAVGAGGGFLLAPLLLSRHTEAEPAAIASATLSVVIIASGLAAAMSARARHVDYRLAAVLTLTALPAGLLGANITALLPRAWFAIFFATLLMLAGLYLAWRPAQGLVSPVLRGWNREFVNADGDLFRYRVPIRRGMLSTFGTAFLAALAGIGGGLFYTPMVTRVMHVPHTLAVPIAQVVNTGMAVMVVSFHLTAGNTGEPMQDVPALATGVIISVPLGRVIHARLGEGRLTRMLAAGLILVSVRTAFFAF